MFSNIMFVVAQGASLVGVGLFFLTLLVLVLLTFSFKEIGKVMAERISMRFVFITLFFLVSASCLKYLFL